MWVWVWVWVCVCVCVCLCVCAHRLEPSFLSVLLSGPWPPIVTSSSSFHHTHCPSPTPCLLPVSSVDGGPTPSTFLQPFRFYLQKMRPREGSLLPDQHPAPCPSLRLGPQTGMAPRASASVGLDTHHWTAYRLQSLPCLWPPPLHTHTHCHSI